MLHTSPLDILRHPYSSAGIASSSRLPHQDTQAGGLRQPGQGKEGLGLGPVFPCQRPLVYKLAPPWLTDLDFSVPETFAACRLVN